MPAQPRGELAGAERGHRGGVGEHEPDPLGRQPRVDGQVRGAGLEHREDRDDRVGRSAEQQGHPLAGTHAEAGEPVREAVGGLVELAVGPRAALEAQGHRVGGARRLRGEQRRDRGGLGRRCGEHGAVA